MTGGIEHRIGEGAPARDRAIALCATMLAFSGTLSPVWVAATISPKLEGLARGALAILAVALLGAGLLVNGRLRFVPLAALAILPFIYLLCDALVRDDLAGAYVYLYKLSPYACAGILWWLLASVSDRVVLCTFLGISSLIALRATLVFVFPYSVAGRPAGADAFIVYEWVGAFPRVFYPGVGLLVLGLLLAVRGIATLGERAAAACLGCLVLGAAGLLVSMTRGVILIAVAVLALECAWCAVDPAISRARKLNLAFGVLLVSGAVAATALSSGYGGVIVKQLADIGASDRLTFDTRDLTWREDQAAAALSMMRTDADWVFGVGPTATVPLSHGEIINELHFGYQSMLWTFGVVGLTLLAAVLIEILMAGFVGPRIRLYWREVLLCAVFVAATGGYSPMFTTPDGAITLAFAAAYLWAPRPNARAAARTESGRAGTPVRARGAPAPRRWSQGDGTAR